MGLFKRSQKEVKVIAAGVRSQQPVAVNSSGGALSIATAYACVRVVSEAIASLPLLVERKRGGTFESVERGRLPYLLNVQPNEWTSAFDFKRQLVSNILLNGNAFIIPEYGIGKEPVRLLLVSPGCGSEAQRVGLYRIDDDSIGIHDYYEEEEIIRIKGVTLDGIRGMSVISFAANTLSIAATAVKNTLKNYANGGTPMGILSNEAAIPTYGAHSTDQLQQIANRMNEAVSRGDRIIVSGGKSNFVNCGMSASDMEFLSTQKFTVREICRFFGVNPSMIYDDTSNNYKSAENANSVFLTQTLDPWLKRIEQEFQRKFLSIQESYNTRFRFDREQMFISDLPSLNAYVKGRIENGTMSPNEARALFNQSAVEGGDKIFVSANMRPVDENTES